MVGDYVVWLSQANVQRIDYAIASLDDAFDFKPVGLGGNINTTPAVNRTVTGEAEKIPKPCHLAAAIDASDIDLSWVRRSRIGSYWADDGGYTAPLGETLEQYVVSIKDGPGGTVLRSFTVTNATTKKYLAADITTDFGSMPAALTFDVQAGFRIRRHLPDARSDHRPLGAAMANDLESPDSSPMSRPTANGRPATTPMPRSAMRCRTSGRSISPVATSR
jgi:hypothetical protein